MEQVTSRKRILMWVIPVMLLPAPLLGTPTKADGASSKIYACVNPSGLTRIVSAPGDCRPSEKAVQWDDAAAQGGASAVQGGTLTVIDSREQTVGPLLDPNTVGLTVNGGRFFVGVGPNRFFSLTGVTFYYTGANCSGTRLVPPSTDVFFPYLRVVGTTGYYASMAATAQEIQVVSYESYSSGVSQGCNVPWWTNKLMLVPATTVDLSGFTAPFSVTVK